MPCNCTLPPNTFQPIYTTPIIADPMNNPVRDQIYYKILGPYSSRYVHENLHSMFTDMDHFPYTRFFRGQYESDNPHVFEREAGIVVHDNKSYRKETQPYTNEYKPNFCFEAACSTRTPCRPDYLSKNSDKHEMEPLLNRIITNISP